MTRLFQRSLPALLAACAVTALANPATPAAAPVPAAKATSAPGIATKKIDTAPAAGGNGGGVSTNGGNTAGQVTPKKPKCPDPTVACKAEKAIGQ